MLQLVESLQLEITAAINAIKHNSYIATYATVIFLLFTSHMQLAVVIYSYTYVIGFIMYLKQ